MPSTIWTKKIPVRLVLKHLIQTKSPNPQRAPGVARYHFWERGIMHWVSMERNHGCVVLNQLLELVTGAKVPWLRQRDLTDPVQVAPFELPGSSFNKKAWAMRRVPWTSRESSGLWGHLRYSLATVTFPGNLVSLKVICVHLVCMPGHLCTVTQSHSVLVGTQQGCTLHRSFIAGWVRVRKLSVSTAIPCPWKSVKSMQVVVLFCFIPFL